MKHENSAMSLRRHYDRNLGDETPLTVEGKVYQKEDTYEIGEIGITHAAVIEVIYKTIDDKYVHLLLVASDGLIFGDMSSGFRVTRYIPEEYALALRSAWQVVRPQPSLEKAEHYFKQIRLSKIDR